LAESGSTEELEKLQFLDPVEPLGSTSVHVKGGVSGAITIVTRCDGGRGGGDRREGREKVVGALADVVRVGLPLNLTSLYLARMTPKTGLFSEKCSKYYFSDMSFRRLTYAFDATIL
jgi:hypothetical protein